MVPYAPQKEGFRRWSTITPVILWSVQCLRQNPIPALWLGATLFLTTSILAVPLLVSEGLAGALRQQISQTPAIVIKRPGNDGIAPWPIDTALETIARIPGVLNPRAYIRGAVKSTGAPVTIMAMENGDDLYKWLDREQTAPQTGEAIVGQDLLPSDYRGDLKLSGMVALDLKIVGRLAAGIGVSQAEIVLLHPDDARRLLGIKPGQATHLAADTFHPKEAAAMVPELQNAFPWPVHIQLRSKAAVEAAINRFQRDGMIAISWFPSFLGAGLIIFGCIQTILPPKREIGLLKSLGWGTRDIFIQTVTQTLLIALPAILTALLASHLTVFHSRTKWATRLFFQDDFRTPSLVMNSWDSLTILSSVAALMLLPLFSLMIVATAMRAVADPATCLQE